jgi:hypothetical protein
MTDASKPSLMCPWDDPRQHPTCRGRPGRILHHFGDDELADALVAIHPDRRGLTWRSSPPK